MLQISIDLEDPKAYDIVNKFINDRLKGLMEDIILVEVVWKMAMGKDKVQGQWWWDQAEGTQAGETVAV